MRHIPRPRPRQSRQFPFQSLVIKANRLPALLAQQIMHVLPKWRPQRNNVLAYHFSYPDFDKQVDRPVKRGLRHPSLKIPRHFG
jgi:hypothetical protein